MIFSVFFNINAFSATNNDAEVHSYDLQLFNENQNFAMPKSAASYFFKIPKDAKLNADCYVSIHFAVSDTLISNLSHMSLSVNGVPIETKWISNIQKTSPNYWKVNIPIDKLKVGALNEIRIESNHRSIIGDCADIDNPGNWVTIYKDSKLHISDTSIYAPLLSNFYSSYFEDYEKKQALGVNFLLPKGENSTLIPNLLKLSSSIGGLYSDRSIINYNVIEGNFNQKATNNSIFIAPINELKNNKNLILPNMKLGTDQGFVLISNRTKTNPYYNTVISGENQEGINKATNFMSNNELLQQAKDKSLIIDSKISDNVSSNNFIQKNGLYKFSDWGYSDINLSGAFHRGANFSFIQPSGLQAGKGSYIKLKFKHSKILLSDRSLLTVYIDGKVINNSKLSQSNAEDGVLKVEIPESALKKPIIKVNIDVYNYIGKIDCSKDYYDSAWTYISSDSEVCLLPGRQSIQPSLDNFPLFNMYLEEKQPQILMSFSTDMNNDDLNVATMLASRIGQNAKAAANFDISKGISELTEEQKEEDMIFIGSFNNICLPEEIKDSMPIVPLENGKFKIMEGVQVIQETLQDKVVIQAIRSPWNTYKRVYVIAYDNESNLKAFKSILSNKGYLQKMSDQVSVIDNTKGVNNLIVIDSEDNKVPVTYSSVIQIIENRTGFPWWIILIALISALACIAAIMKLRKKNNQFQDAGDKMKKSQGFQVENTEDEEENQEDDKK